MRSQWKRIRYRLEWLGLLLATKLIPLCSRRVSNHLARTAGALLSFLDRQRFEVAVDNLRVAFGDQFPEDERRKIARESFQYFARTMVDLLWRSEEHTSELQSHHDLVCRLLLEKKKISTCLLVRNDVSIRICI